MFVDASKRKVGALIINSEKLKNRNQEVDGKEEYVEKNKY